VQKGNRAITEFDCSCFNGEYVTQTIDNDYLDRIRNMRNDSTKDTGDESLNVVGMDLHNNI
jgi:amidophosphoribosyltransferase